MSTHTTIRSAVASLVEGVALRVSSSSDAADMVATEQGAHVVAIAVDEGPADQWGGVRMWVVSLSAAAGRGCNEAAARALCATTAATLRAAMLDDLADASGYQVIDAATDTIGREGDVIVLRQTYQLQAEA